MFVIKNKKNLIRSPVPYNRVVQTEKLSPLFPVQLPSYHYMYVTSQKVQLNYFFFTQSLKKIEIWPKNHNVLMKMTHCTIWYMKIITVSTKS